MKMTNWLTRLVPGHAPNGRPILSVLGKRTYKIANGRAAVIDGDEQIPFHEKDEFNGSAGPQSDSVKHESDLVAFKPMTDFALIGMARSAKGKRMLSMSVGIQVGKAAKIVKVTGDRKAFVTPTGIGFSEPEPFEEMPLDYSRAYGGRDDRSDPGAAYVYPRNPVGKGFIVKPNPKALQDLPLPNLEDPARLLTPSNLALQRYEKWMEYPDPASFGFTGRHYHPRIGFAGLPPQDRMMAEMERQRALQKLPGIGAAPSDPLPPPVPMLNPQFHNGAAPGLALPYLSGDETIKLANLDADHPQFAFSLPGARPAAYLDVGDGPERLPMALQTVTVLKNTGQITLVWRGSAFYGGPEAMAAFQALEFSVED